MLYVLVADIVTGCASSCNGENGVEQLPRIAYIRTVGDTGNFEASIGGSQHVSVTSGPACILMHADMVVHCAQPPYTTKVMTILEMNHLPSPSSCSEQTEIQS